MSELSKLIFDDAEKIVERIEADEMSGKTVMITGASGLIGHYLIACLKHWSLGKKKIKVIAVLHSEPAVYFKEFLDYAEAKIVRGDITDHGFLTSLPDADYIIHAAGYGQPGRFMEDQVKTLKINTFSTFLLFTKLNPGGKFLFVSTSEVYSGLPKPPYKESEIGTTNTTHPRSCFIEAKRCGEAICNAYRSAGVEAKSVRLSLAYGPGTKIGDKRVLNNFIAKGIEGKIGLLDQGLANRTYCYVADAVEIMWRILLDGKEPIYNVGGHSKITIGDLARKIGGYMNVPVAFPETSENAMAGAPDDVSLDMSKAEEEFDKTEFVPLDEGLKRTIEWQKILLRR